MENIYNKNPFLKNIINCFFIISGTAMTILLSVRGSILNIKIGIICSFFILCFICFKIHFLENLFKKTNKKEILISLFFSIIISYDIMMNFYNINILYLKNIKLISMFLGGLSFISISIFLNWFFNWLIRVSKNFINDSDKIEKYYLFIFLFTISFFMFIVYNKTDVFYALDNTTGYNIIYSTDTGSQALNNVYLNINAPDNDLRQPLFGVFAIPFAIIAKALSNVFNFIPHLYFILINIIQVFLLQISMVLISRMLKLSKINKLFFLMIVSLSYPFLLFSINMEQYIFPLFWLILYIYAYIFNKDKKEFYFVGATGTLLTTGVVFLLLSDSKSIRNTLIKIFKTLIEFFAFITIFGQLYAFLEFYATFKAYLVFTGKKLTFFNKLYQYIDFVFYCLFKPHTGVDKTLDFVSYQITYSNSVNIFGIIILLFIIIGFILGFKEKFTKICFAWVIYSFILLCLVGWGTAENALILYSLYFSWAFISLIFIAIDKMFDKIKPIKYIVFTGLVIILLIINIQGIYDLIKFGIQYYPVLR